MHKGHKHYRKSKKTDIFPCTSISFKLKHPVKLNCVKETKVSLDAAHHAEEAESGTGSSLLICEKLFFFFLKS